ERPIASSSRGLPPGTSAPARRAAPPSPSPRDRRQHGHSIAIALAAPHYQLVCTEVHVLGAEPGALEQAEPSPVEEPRHESRRAVQLVQNGAYLVAREDHGKPSRLLRPHDPPGARERPGPGPRGRETGGPPAPGSAS